jgi:hypothetical protein
VRAGNRIERFPTWRDQFKAGIVKQILAWFDFRFSYWEIGLFVILAGAIALGLSLLALDFVRAHPADPTIEPATPTATRINVSAPVQPPTSTPSPLPNVAPPKPSATGASRLPNVPSPAMTAPANHPAIPPEQTCPACHNQIRSNKK